VPHRNPGFQLFQLFLLDGRSWIAISCIQSQLAYIDFVRLLLSDLLQSSHHVFLMVSACSSFDMLGTPARLAPVRLSAKYAWYARVDINYEDRVIGMLPSRPCHTESSSKCYA
jgi:hypothetical protein